MGVVKTFLHFLWGQKGYQLDERERELDYRQNHNRQLPEKAKNEAILLIKDWKVVSALNIQIILDYDCIRNVGVQNL